MLEDVKKGGHQPSAPFQPLPRKVNDILVSIAREDPPDARDVSASVYPRLVDLSSEASPPFLPFFPLCRPSERSRKDTRCRDKTRDRSASCNWPHFESNEIIPFLRGISPLLSSLFLSCIPCPDRGT